MRGGGFVLTCSKGTVDRDRDLTARPRKKQIRSDGWMPCHVIAQVPLFTLVQTEIKSFGFDTPSI